MVPSIKMLADRAARYTTAAVVSACAPLPTTIGDVSAVPPETGTGADYSTYQDQHCEGILAAGKAGTEQDGSVEGTDGEEGDWYIDEFGRRVSRGDSDLSRHETFYCCVQSACYSLCFYGIPMAESIFSKSTRNLQIRQHWETVLTCAYNPLRYCLHSVRLECLRVLHAVDLSLFHIIDTAVGRGGLRALLHQSSASSVTAGASTAGVNPLDTFFPFDPCLLRRVHAHVEGGYRVWQGAPPGLSPSACGADDFDELFQGDSGVLQDALVADNDDDDDGDDSDSAMSSVASSIASMAFVGNHGQGSVLGIAGVGSYASTGSYVGGSYAETSAMGMSYGTPGAGGSELLLGGAHRGRGGGIRNHASHTTIAGGAYLTGGVGVGVGIVSGSVHSNTSSNIDTVEEDQWNSILRTKRSRQYSVGSAGSW